MGADPREVLDKELHTLPDGWTWEWFTDVMDVEGGTQPPASEFVEGPQDGYVRLVQIRDFDSDSHVTYIPDSGKWRKCNQSDVLIARYGAALGRICTGLEGAYNVALAKVVPSDRMHLSFAYYLLKADYFQRPLLAGGGRSAQAGFNKSGLAVISLPIPQQPEQRAIAHILGTLDRKIELNRRMSRTLEAIAQALFNSWFVTFEPVRVKAEGRDPGLPVRLVDLFPDSLQESHRGDIPTGWKLGRVGDLATLSRDAVTPGDFPNEIFDHFSIPAFDEGRTPRQEEGRTIKSNKFVVRPGSVLLSKLNPRISRVWLPDVDPDRRSICSTEYLVVLPKAGVSRAFLYLLLSSENFGTEFAALVTGTSGSHQRVSADNLLRMATVRMPKPVMQAFSSLVTPLLDRVRHNLAESRILAELRDTLLPKLISGTLRVRLSDRPTAHAT